MTARFLTFMVACAAALSAAAETRICAHRGDVARAPENTLPALISAVERGAHMIEFDVRLTRDERLVLLHDDTLDRTTDGTGKLADVTLADLRKLDAGSWFGERFAGTRIPTFQEALEVIPNHVRCNVHLKDAPGLAAKAAIIVKEMNRLDQCVLACTLDQIAEARAVVPEILTCNMSRVRGDRSAYIDQTIAAKTHAIQLHKREGLDNLAEDVRRLHDAGIQVYYFGANDAETIRTLQAAGVDYILTDKLDMAIETLKAVQPESTLSDGSRPNRTGGAQAPWIFNNKFVPGAGCVCPQHEGLSPDDARQAHQTAGDLLDQL
jgi:glycerophosphoryl diester phosphodiesterase